MTKTLLSAALIAGLGIAAFAPQAAYAVDGTINFTGAITATTCVVGAGSPTTTTVELPTVSTTALKMGQLAGYKAFAISVSGCSTSTKATTYFEQGPNTLADGNLRNTGTSNVEVRLFNSDQISQVQLNNTSGALQSSQTVSVDSSGAATLNYWAAYHAAVAAATVGSVSTSVQFSMQYN